MSAPDDPLDFDDESAGDSEPSARPSPPPPDPGRTDEQFDADGTGSPEGRSREPIPFPAYEERRRLSETADIPEADVQFHIGIIGGSGSGKTYLFQAIVHRLETPGNYGVLTRYLNRDGVRLYAASKPGKKGEIQQLRKFNETYQSWKRLPPNRVDEVFHYHLFLDYKTGVLGQRDTTMKVSFLDCSGELFQEVNSDPESLSRKSWKSFEQARVMVFCLPLWAVFPNHQMKPADWAERREHIIKFLAVIGNYKQIRQELKAKRQRLPKCRFVVALTQAEDRRCGLSTLTERWIRAYVDNKDHQLKRLSRIGGPTKYLAGARSVSDYVRKEFEVVTDQTVASILPDLEVDGNQPWLVPVTAIDGKILNREAGVPPPNKHPVPAHVELLLLLGLCEAHNALM